MSATALEEGRFRVRIRPRPRRRYRIPTQMLGLRLEDAVVQCSYDVYEDVLPWATMCGAARVVKYNSTMMRGMVSVTRRGYAPKVYHLIKEMSPIA